MLTPKEKLEQLLKKQQEIIARQQLQDNLKKQALEEASQSQMAQSSP